MGLFWKILVSATASRERAVADARRRLEREAARAGLGPVRFAEREIGPAVDAGEELREGLRAIVGRGRARIDRVLYGIVPDGPGGAAIGVALPFSGADALPAELAATLRLGVPASAVLVRSALGSWGLGSFASAPGEEDDPAAARVREALEGAEGLKDGIEWDHELPGDYVVKLPWALQVHPIAPDATLCIMTTAEVGFFRKSLGLKLFLRKLPLVEAALGGLAGGPAAGAAPPIFPHLFLEEADHVATH